MYMPVPVEIYPLCDIDGVIVQLSAREVFDFGGGGGGGGGYPRCTTTAT